MIRPFISLLVVLNAFGGFYSSHQDLPTLRIVKDLTVEKIVYEKAFGEDPPTSISISIEYLSVAKEDGPEKAINSHLAALVWDNFQEYYHSEVELLAPNSLREIANTIIKEFVSSTYSREEEQEEIIHPVHSLQLLGHFSYSANNLLCYRLSTTYEDDGVNARPFVYERALVFDRITGKVVSLSELINPGAANEVGRLLSKALMAQIKEPISREIIEPSPNFAMSDTGITFIYDTGEIASLSQGIVCLELPWSDVWQFLKIIPE